MQRVRFLRMATISYVVIEAQRPLIFNHNKKCLLSVVRQVRSDSVVATFPNKTKG